MKKIPKMRIIFSVLAPWLVILGLIYLALFAHPGVVSEAVTPPPHFYS